jgi:hypothetical protein
MQLCVSSAVSSNLKNKIENKNKVVVDIIKLYLYTEHKIIPFYNNKDKPTEVTIRFNNNYETRLPL